MNKIIKITAVAAITLTATGIFAAPPPPKNNHKHKDNNGIRLATDIVNLVNASVRLITGTPQTVIVNTPPPVVVTTPPQPKVIHHPIPPKHKTIVTPPPRPKPVTYHYENPTVRPVKTTHGNFRR